MNRTIPHSLEAEQGILGCIFLDPNESMPVCLERIKSGPEAFYDIRHKEIYAVLVKMFEGREAIDVITVQSELKKRQSLEGCGGITYLAQLQDVVPSASNITFYISTLLEKEILRKIINHSALSMELAYEGSGNLEAVISEFETSALAIAQPLIEKGERNVRELVKNRLSFWEDCHERGGGMLGISTGFRELDKMTNGLQKGDMIVIAARPSLGKAQPLTSQVLTPTGFKLMGEIAVGDMVIGSDGKAHAVTGVYPQGIKQVYRVLMSDGTSTRCCKEHLWFTQTRNERRKGCAGSVKNTQEIINTIHRADGGSRNHVIPTVLPVQFSGINDLPIHPWLMGALIGDGTLGGGSILFHKPEADVLEKVKSLLPDSDCATDLNGLGLRIKRKHRSNEPSEVMGAIVKMGLNVNSEDKFIPEDYLMASVQDRVELLRGLLDTDGFAVGTCMEYTTSSERLMKDFMFLVRSLGGICRMTSRIPVYSYKGNKHNGKRNYRANIWFKDQSIIPVSSEKHLRKIKSTDKHVHRSIKSIEVDGFEECQCIAIDSSDHLYVTDNFIVTHNTSLAMNIAEHVAMSENIPVGVFSLEMTAESLVGRLVASRSRVNERSLTSGVATIDDMKRVATASLQVSKAPIYIDDTGGLTIGQLRAKARRWVAQKGVGLIVIDYLQLLKTAKKKDRREEVDEISTQIKAMAKDLGVPVVVICQLNRELDKQSERKPRLSDLRESGQIEQDADVVGMLYNNDPQAMSRGDRVLPVSLLIAKQRNGPTGDVNLTFHKEICRFESVSLIEQP